MEAFLSSTLAVAIAEIGDKTQLLSLLLVARFNQRYQIVLGILLATILNHALSAWLGVWAAGYLPEGIERWIIAGSFILVGLWILIPDKAEGTTGRFDQYGALIATTVLFFLAEIGDKTQVATVILAAQYQSLVWVTAGTTLGMLIANLPVIWFGGWILSKIPLNAVRIGACVVFLALGLVTLLYPV